MKKSNELPRAFALVQDIVDFHVVDDPFRRVIFFLGGGGNDVVAHTLGIKWYPPKVVGPITSPSENNFPLVLHLTPELFEDDGTPRIT